MRWSRRFSQAIAVVTSEFKLWLLLAAAGTVVATVFVLLFAPFFDVRAINVRRQDPRIDPGEIQQILTPLFDERLVLVTRSHVESLLKEKYPDITSVKIEKNYPSTLIVSLELEPVVAAAVIDDAPKGASGATVMTATGAYSYITRSGMFITSAISLSSSPLPELYLIDFTIRPEERMKLFTPDFLEMVFLARDTLRRDFGMDSEKIVIYVRAKEFHIKTKETTLWFDSISLLPVQLQRFREFLKDIPLAQAKEYIDLRIADKVVYK